MVIFYATAFSASSATFSARSFTPEISPAVLGNIFPAAFEISSAVKTAVPVRLLSAVMDIGCSPV